MGQVQAGDLSMNLNGTVSAGYTDTYGSLINSAHSLTMGGSGTLSGSFYSPNFVNFNFSPYYNQSRANSGFQSIFDSSGFSFSSGIFGGSHFPGSISYAKSYNSQGNFAVPGVADFTTHGNSSTFGINWNELLPDLPTLSVGYQQGSNLYSVVGTNDNGSSDSRAFNLRSGYRLEGFNLSAFYALSASQAQIPQVLGNAQQEQTSNSDSDGYGFGVSHGLPLHGQWSSSFNRSEMNSDYLGYKYNGTVDSVNTTAGLQPTNKLHLQVGVNYSDNLAGLLYQSTVQSGGNVLPGFNQPQSSSHSFDLMSSASYSFLPNLQSQLYAERRTQYFLGQNFGANSYGAGVSYSHGLLGGSISASGSLSDNTLDHSDMNTLGFTGSVNYSRPIRGWMTSGTFSYAQNVQTLLISYTSSYYSYSGSVRRHFGSNLSWSLSAGGSRTGLTAQPSTDSTSQTYSTGLSYSHWAAATASYSKSDGQALQGGGGLVAIPLPPVVPENLLILYGGKSYSFSVSSSPIRGLTVAAAFAKANSNTNNAGLASWNNTQQFNTLVQYQFRKMYFTGGYSRLEQGFSASSTPPAMISSFYFGVSRWFNFF